MFDSIEGLSVAEIENLYNDIAEKSTEYKLSWETTAWYCYTECACDNGTRYAHNYEGFNSTGHTKYGTNCASSAMFHPDLRNGGWYIDGGCYTNDPYARYRFYVLNCIPNN